MPDRTFRSRTDDRLFYEGDFSEPDEKLSIPKLIGSTIAFAAVGHYLYRGLRGAGYSPFAAKFWKPLAQVQRDNIKQSFWKSGFAQEISRESVSPLTGTFDKSIFKKRLSAAVEKEAASGFGLRTMGEGAVDLFSRTIKGIPEVFDYLGVPKGLTGFAKKIPDYILGGEIPDAGFYRASKQYQSRFAGTKFAARTVPGTIGRIMTRVVLPAYVATLGFNYLDYRLRRSEPLDKTPLDEGITGAGATMWAKSRMFMQDSLDNVGALNAHKYMQNLFPGYLRAAGMVAGAAWGYKSSAAFLKGQFSWAASGMVASRILSRSFVTGIAGYALESALGRSPEEVKRIYSGEQPVPVRKGRWWEFGRTPYEGGRIDYYRPHWYPMMMSRYKEKGELYPSEDWKWQHHWLVGPLTGHGYDPYAWEKKYYKERPYPITGGAFDDVPLIGPLLNFTLGRIVKPRKFMHEEEWSGSGGKKIEQPDETERIRHIPKEASTRLGLGEIPRGGMGEIVSPDDIRNFLGEQQYRLTEWAGLPGFLIQEQLRGITGKESLFETSRLQESSRATGFERSYWDRDLGGLAGTTEIFRRFFPHRRRQVEEYNPIVNEMGKKHEWLPGPEYFIDFKHGDPFIKVPMGEARLPGGGYESLHELHSTIPGVYDAMDRFLILSDVAPYSDQYKHYAAIVNMWVRGGVLDKRWTAKYKETIEQRRSRMRRYEFTPRRFSRIKEQVNDALTSDNEGLKQEGQYNKLERFAGSTWEKITHAVSNAPIPGVSWLATKLLPARTPIEHYERFQVFGRESASWSAPIRDFAKVYAQEVMGKVNPAGIPSDVRKRRDIEEYFDRLEYIKYKQLEKLAGQRRDWELEKAFKKKKESTMFGLDPYKSWQNIYSAMPARERDYFEDFKQVTGEERERIRELVSPDMRRIYEAQWELADARAGRKVKYTQGVHRDQELSEYFTKKNLPGPNWIGWHPDVDLDKVKLKVVKNEAMDIHDFNLWEAQEREMANEQVPNIENYDAPNPQYDTPKLRADLLATLLNRGVSNPRIEVTTQPSYEPKMNMDFDVSYDQSDRYKKSMGRRAYMMAH